MTTPRLSVVIPTFNRAGVLDRNLEHLAAQTLPADEFEVLVCDDASTDDTAGVAERWEQDSRLRVRYLPGEKRFAGGARNRGVDAATADRVLFLGDDILADPGCLAAHLDAADRFGPEVVPVGYVRYERQPAPTRFMEFLEAEGIHHDFPRLAQLVDDPVPGRYFYACNASLPRAAHLAIAGYDERIQRAWEDTEYGVRLERAGYPLRYVPEASASHVHPIDFPQYVGFLRRGRDDIARVVASLRASGETIPSPPAHPVLDAVVSDQLVDFAAATVQRTERYIPERIARAVYRRVLRYERRKALLAASGR